jgi:hypothetical protein
VRDDAHTVVSGLPNARLSGSFSVQVDGEPLTIPYRIYSPEPPAGDVSSLSSTQQTLLHCLYTRHHDGFVRQRHLERVLGSDRSWVVPYVVQLVGEYVVEILIAIAERLDVATPGTPERLRYGRFVAENRAFFELTASRVTSYWNCYYRYPDRAQAIEPWPGGRQRRRDSHYVGFALIDALDAAGQEVS